MELQNQAKILVGYLVVYLHFDLVVEEPSTHWSVFHRRGMCTRLRALDESCQGWHSQGLNVNIKLTNVTTSKVTWQRLKSVLVLVYAFLELLVVLLTHLHKN